VRGIYCGPLLHDAAGPENDGPMTRKKLFFSISLLYLVDSIALAGHYREEQRAAGARQQDDDETKKKSI
jgi:hypothetical protein